MVAATETVRETAEGSEVIELARFEPRPRKATYRRARDPHHVMSRPIDATVFKYADPDQFGAVCELFVVKVRYQRQDRTTRVEQFRFRSLAQAEAFAKDLFRWRGRASADDG